MISPEWPALPFEDWESTCDTLHMWTQIVGKTRLALTPLENHWWNVTLYVTPSGLRTGPIPYRREAFEVEFDFIAHRLSICSSEGGARAFALYPRSVADFYGEYMASLGALGIEVKLNLVPEEFDEKTPFNEDTHHAAYDRAHVESFRRILVNSDRILKQFRAGFIGKCSPVHFFWGSFDLAVTRFNGKRAALPPAINAMTREAYSHEVISCGFWPGDRRFKHPAFYAYAAPAPAGFDKATARPDAAGWDTTLGEFIFKYEEVRKATSPDAAILDFCQSTYDAAATLAGWDREALERKPL